MQQTSDVANGTHMSQLTELNYVGCATLVQKQASLITGIL